MEYNRPGAENSGFTLIEVMVAGSIAIVVVLALTTALFNMKKSQVSLQRAVEFNGFQSLVQKTLDNDETCATALGNQPFTAGGSASVNIMVTQVTYPGLVYNTTTSGYRVTAVRLVDATPAGTTPLTVLRTVAGTPTSFTRYLARLEMDVSRSNPGQTTFVPYKTITYGVSALVNAAGRLQFCSGERSPEQVCLELGGTYDPSAPPDERCDVLSSCVTLGGYEQTLQPWATKTAAGLAWNCTWSSMDGTGTTDEYGSFVGPTCACGTGFSAVEVKNDGTVRRFRCQRCD